MVVEGQPQIVPGVFAQGKAAAHPRATGQAHFKDIREDDIEYLSLLPIAQAIGSGLRRFAWIVADWIFHGVGEAPEHFRLAGIAGGVGPASA